MTHLDTSRNGIQGYFESPAIRDISYVGDFSFQQSPNGKLSIINQQFREFAGSMYFAEYQHLIYCFTSQNLARNQR